MTDPEPLIVIRRTPNNPYRYGQWYWTCLVTACRISGEGLASQQAAVREGCRHLVSAFDRHHEPEASFPSGNRHYIACRCGWTCDNERTEAAAEYSLELHIEDARKALPACCVCGSDAVVYRNYREQPFCAHCANCTCTQDPCIRTAVTELRIA